MKYKTFKEFVLNNSLRADSNILPLIDDNIDFDIELNFGSKNDEKFHSHRVEDVFYFLDFYDREDNLIWIKMDDGIISGLAFVKSYDYVQEMIDKYKPAKIEMSVWYMYNGNKYTDSDIVIVIIDDYLCLHSFKYG